MMHHSDDDNDVTKDSDVRTKFPIQSDSKCVDDHGGTAKVTSRHIGVD